jgi:hypothetical protein
MSAAEREAELEKLEEPLGVAGRGRFILMAEENERRDVDIP